MSCARATSPMRRTTGSGLLAAATPNAVETVPSMPLAPRLDEDARSSGPGGEVQLDVADRHRGRDDRASPPGAAGDCPSSRAASGSDSVRAGAEPVAQRGAAPGVRLGPGREPRGVRGRRGRLRPGPRAPPPGRRRRSRSPQRRGPARPLGVQRELLDARAARPARRAAAWRWADRPPGRRARDAPARRSRGRAAAGRRWRSRWRRGARPTRGRRATASPGARAAYGRRPGRPRHRARARPATITPRAGGAPGSAGVAAASAGDALHPGAAVRAARHRVLGEGCVEDERLAQAGS